MVCSAEVRAVPLASPGRGGFEELKVHFLLEKEQQQSRRLIGDYLALTEMSVSGVTLNTTEIIHAARCVCSGRSLFPVCFFTQ